MEQSNKTTSQEPVRGLYRLNYGYADHTMLFISTDIEFEENKDATICLETAKYTQEDINLCDSELITQDQDFIEKFINLGLVSDINPFEYL